ncbi:hypothetical protein [Pediococcus acidilactici]|uniref:hypothetical protein n=1 Tax=Pediococcus acidilactici TaxID=1254 RepID=UPI00232FC5A9|nr:hypothetical protein [Pediococcus acidilactici]MDB8860134.1 hypothetical protein [Pediococcus acidilactici]MDB8861131.1 hypothetical protein [Pediococcus acidilactici]MDB8863828.1 hypothetical protein [Pediococcus acidilactici]MDB8866022.1 hypothetical protein [Pediococcus acidilactici]
MKLAKIKEDLYLNSHNVVFIEFDEEDNTTLITMVNGAVFSLDLPIKKYSTLLVVARSTYEKISILC